VMFASCLLVVLFIREPAEAEPVGARRLSFADSFRSLAGNLKDVFGGERSLLSILLAILFWFVGYNAIETFFTSYAKYYLGLKESTGALILGFFSVTFMVASIGSGFLGGRIGRNRTIRIGLLVTCATLVAALFVRRFLPLALLFAAGGLGWSLVNVNSLPMVVDMTTLEKVGGYTGLYYFFSQAANIIAPPAAGALIDAFGYGSLMVFSSVLFVAAFFIMSLVRRGEALDSGAR